MACYIFPSSLQAISPDEGLQLLYGKSVRCGLCNHECGWATTKVPMSKRGKSRL